MKKMTKRRDKKADLKTSFLYKTQKLLKKRSKNMKKYLPDN